MSEAILSLKAAGNQAFAAKDFKSACCSYTEALATTCSSLDIRVSLLSNRAACHFRLDNFQSSIDDCTAVLDSDKSHAKALYRRAQAFEALQQHAAAFKDAKR
jgi:tetratricopeptide (TPR) repeat protein